MITLLNDLPDHVIGLVADGQITREDYSQTVTPAVKAALAKHAKVSIYYELGTGFTGVDVGAGFEDFFLGVTHLMSWKRIAVVTDVEWMRKGSLFFGNLMPAEVQCYTMAERDQARAWVVG